MVKKYLYNEPYGDNCQHNQVIEKFEKEILEEYWDCWYDNMVKKYGEGHELITEENCIEDWVIVNWAWTDKDDQGRSQEYH